MWLGWELDRMSDMVLFCLVRIMLMASSEESDGCLSHCGILEGTTAGWLRVDTAGCPWLEGVGDMGDSEVDRGWLCFCSQTDCRTASVSVWRVGQVEKSEMMGWNGEYTDITS